MQVTIYGNPGCAPCKAAVRWFETRGHSVQYVNLADDPDAAERFRVSGHRHTPVVVYGEHTAAGYRPDIYAKWAV